MTVIDESRESEGVKIAFENLIYYLVMIKREQQPIINEICETRGQ